MNAVGELLRKIYSAMTSDPTSVTFACIIAGILALCLFYRLVKWPAPLGGLDRSGPTLLTTVGVLGTFTGILIGLLDFDVREIDDSVPGLLEGLKIAFISSVLGIGAAVFLRLVQSLAARTPARRSAATPEDILAALTSIDARIKAASEWERGALEAVREAISADGEGSLLTQMQKMRQDFTDGNRQLVDEFRNFAKSMAENNSKALIEALEGVIRDFNTRINEQFGENFKQLNEAVAALLSWQENYKRHIELLEAQFQAALQGIQKADESLRQIADRTERIPATLDRLGKALDVLDAANDALRSHLDAVSGLKDRALEAFPTIEQNLKTLTAEFGAAVHEATAESTQALHDQREAQQELQKGLDDVQRQFAAAQDRIAAQLEQAAARASERLVDNFGKFDEEMQKELTRCIETLGRNLGALSQKFADDYRAWSDHIDQLAATIRRLTAAARR